MLRRSLQNFVHVLDGTFMFHTSDASAALAQTLSGHESDICHAFADIML